MPTAPANAASIATLDFRCTKCGQQHKIQANLGQDQPIKPGAVRFPVDAKFKCPSCGTEHDLSAAKRQIEFDAKRPIV